MVSPHYVGHLDAIANGEVFGWALNVTRPLQPVFVSVYLDGVFAASASAGYYRPDVARALNCSGRNGFYVDLRSLCDVESSASVEVRYPDGKPLDGGPLIYRESLVAGPRPGPTLLFMHIPKTAGTAFREVVLLNYRQSEVCFLYGDPPGFPGLTLRDLPIGQRYKLRLVFGHYGYGAHVDMPNHCNYATLIRDPLGRIWSHYSHLVRDRSPAVMDGNRCKYIEQLLEEQKTVHLDNIYVRYFCGIEELYLPAGAVTRDHYDLAVVNARRPNVHFEFQSDLDLAYDSFARELGWEAGLQCTRLNTSPSPELLPNGSQEQAIRHFNKWDFKLFEQMLNIVPASSHRIANTG